MTQEELIREVGKVTPNGMYSEEVIQLAFTMFTHGYNYAVDKACERLKNHSETDYYELIPDANYCGAVKLSKNKMIEDFRKAMEE